MPHYHCTKCHHEFEAIEKEASCDWCGAPGKILEEKTPLEKMCDDIINSGGFEKWINK
jgi:DNA-directed RNA polymerase subunit RPC12/RpoP